MRSVTASEPSSRDTGSSSSGMRRRRQAVAASAGFRHLDTIAPGANQPGDDPCHIHRIVTKDKPAGWLLSRLWLYRRPTLARWYARGRKR